MILLCLLESDLHPQVKPDARSYANGGEAYGFLILGVNDIVYCQVENHGLVDAPREGHVER